MYKILRTMPGLIAGTLLEEADLQTKLGTLFEQAEQEGLWFEEYTSDTWTPQPDQEYYRIVDGKVVPTITPSGVVPTEAELMFSFETEEEAQTAAYAINAALEDTKTELQATAIQASKKMIL